MIERQVTFQVIPGRERDFEDLFAQAYSPAMSRQPGFVSVTLLKEQGEDAVYQLAIRFESLETATAWRDSADHRALAPRIKALYNGNSLQIYEVVAHTRRGDSEE